jgi:hypothetical protein
MASTRFHNDPTRIEKQLQEQTDIGRYMLNVPGQGVNLPFVDDPHIRLQQWGANLHTNTIALESELKGLTRRLHRDVIKTEQSIPKVNSKSTASSYASTGTSMITDQSRTTHPAWMVRDTDLDQYRWNYLPLDPQQNTTIPFAHQVQTRTVYRDVFIPPRHKSHIPEQFVFESHQPQSFTLPQTTSSLSNSVSEYL